MINLNQEFNSFICKCGNISCRNIHLHSFSNQIQNSNDQLLYSRLHHKSLRVFNSNSIVVDRCCGNCLHFHCSECQEQFSITKFHNSKSQFIIGFGLDCLAYLEPSKCNEIVIIPEFPIALRSYISLSEKKVNEHSDFNTDSLLLDDYISNCCENDDEEIFSYDSDEDMMFGTAQTDLIIGKYNERSIFSFGQSSSAN